MIDPVPVHCFSITFHKLRLLQLSLSKMVDLDRDFKCQFAIGFVLNMGISSYILYLVLTMDIPNIIIMFLIWSVELLSSVGVISVFAAFVNEAVRDFICFLSLQTI